MKIKTKDVPHEIAVLTIESLRARGLGTAQIATGARLAEKTIKRIENGSGCRQASYMKLELLLLRTRRPAEDAPREPQKNVLQRLLEWCKTFLRS